jgi:mannose-1-phosphate guanylyltransferase
VCLTHVGTAGDHHFANDEAFITHVDSAFAQAKSHPERVILLGVEPGAPEEAYGWIEPGSSLASESGTFISEVSRFWEKPCRRIASHLMQNGCLWNSFVMVGADDSGDGR